MVVAVVVAVAEARVGQSSGTAVAVLCTDKVVPQLLLN